MMRAYYKVWPTPCTMTRAFSLVAGEPIPFPAMQEYSPVSDPSRREKCSTDTLPVMFTDSLGGAMSSSVPLNNQVMLGIGLASNTQYKFSVVCLC